MSGIELEIEVGGASVYLWCDSPAMRVTITKDGKQESVTLEQLNAMPIGIPDAPGVAQQAPEATHEDDQVSQMDRLERDYPPVPTLLTDEYLLPSGRKVICPVGQVLSRPEQEAVQQLARMAAPKPGVFRPATLRDPIGSILRVMTDTTEAYAACLISASQDAITAATPLVFAMFDDRIGTVAGRLPTDEAFQQPQDFDLLWLGDGVTDVDEIGYWWKHIKPGGYLCGRGYAVDDGITAALDQIVESTKGMLPLHLVSDTPVWYIQQPIPQ